MTYANMDNVPTQVSGSSSVLATDWNTYVRDNFDDIKAGHVVVADNSGKSGLGTVADGSMVYQLDVKKLFVYVGGVWYELANYTQNTSVASGGAPFAPFYSPVGMITPFGGSAAPSGWLLCNGASLSTSTNPEYTALFSIIGTTYGGSGATAFNVPNLLGRTVVGAGTAGAQNGANGTGALSGGTAITARALGSWFGDIYMQQHTHSISAWSTTDGAGAHSHSVSHTDQVYQGTGPGVWPAGNNGVNGYGAGNQGHSVSTNGAHNHTIPATTSNNQNTTYTTSGTEQNSQPSLALTYIIKY